MRNSLPIKVTIQYKDHDSRNNDDFLGLEISNGTVLLSVPAQYPIGNHADGPIEPSTDDRRIIINYLKTFALQNNTRRDGHATIISEGIDSSRLDSYMWILEDYISNGLPLRQETTYKKRPGGTIDWKRTIQSCHPLIANNSVLFHTVIHSKKQASEDILIKAYSICVNESAKYMGWLYDVHNPPFSNDSIMPSLLIEAINNELSSSFNDLKIQRLTHMKNILSEQTQLGINHTVRYGSTKYQYIFEEMIRRVFANQDVRNYMPHYEYCLDNTNNKSPKLRPDCIRTVDNTIAILDAKFYQYSATGDEKDLPQASDIMKQIAYGEYALEYVDSRMLLFNAFLLPSKNGELLRHIGFAKPAWCKNPDNQHIVNVVLIDLESLIEYWCGFNNHDLPRQIDSLIRKNTPSNRNNIHN